MINRRLLIATLANGIALSAITLPALAQERLQVVASFSIIGDIVSEVAGDAIDLTTIVGFDQDAHSFQPRPADARALGDADLVIISGLEFEPWLDRLAASAGFDGTTVVASTGITPRTFADGGDHDDDDHAAHYDHADDVAHDGHDDHASDEGHDAHASEADGGHEGHDHGEFDPHAWQDPAIGIVYVRNIAAALIEADAANADLYRQRSEAYIARLETLDAEIRQQLAEIPAERRKVVTSHDSLGYFAQAYQFQFYAPQGASTEAEASAGDVARIIDLIRDEGITAVFLENSASPRLLEQITSETDANIGGTLYTDALSGTDGPAPTYEAMLRHNAQQLIAVLKTN